MRTVTVSFETMGFTKSILLITFFLTSKLEIEDVCPKGLQENYGANQLMINWAWFVDEICFVKAGGWQQNYQLKSSGLAS